MKALLVRCHGSHTAEQPLHHTCDGKVLQPSVQTTASLTVLMALAL